MSFPLRQKMEMSRRLLNVRQCNVFGMLLTTTTPCPRSAWRCSTTRLFSSAKQRPDVGTDSVDNKYAFRRVVVPSDGNDSSITTFLKKGRCPIALFRNYATVEKATNDIAAQCLQAFQDKLHSLPEPARQAEIDKRRGGQTVLNWLWDKYDDVRVPEDRKLINIMVELLIAEGREQMAWDWMLNHETGKSAQLPQHIRYNWRKLVAYSLVSAKADDTNGSLDEALMTYFKLTKLANIDSKPRYHKSRHRKPGYCIPLNPTSQFLFKCVHGGLLPQSKEHAGVKWELMYPNTSLRLWTDFYHLVSKLDPYRWVENQAFMKMLPVGNQKPDPFPALALLETIDADKSDSHHLIAKHAALVSHYRRYNKCSQLLDALGHSEEALWVKQAAYRCFGSKAICMRRPSGPVGPSEYVRKNKELEAKHRSDTNPTPVFSDTSI